ncbi:MAG: hypothetical protein AB8B59_09105 [Maribacter sp.]
MLASTTNILKKEKEISIFRTSLIDLKDISQVKSVLDILVGKKEWNFDLEDVDNILRIHAATHLNGFLAQELRKLGFECEELF